LSSSERISERLPNFYKSWARDSVIYRIVDSVSRELDDCQGLIVEMMRSHWVDTASKEDLDRMGPMFNLRRIIGEDDEHYKIRLKRAIIDFTGGGTTVSINSMLKTLIGDDIEIIENPSTEGGYEVRVMSGDTWIIGSNSIEEVTKPEITIEAEDVIENPEVVNIDRAESINFKGKLQKGDKLVLKDGKCLLNNTDVTKKTIMTDIPHLLRRPCTWRYAELIREKIGIFDSTTFDESIFAVNIPKAKISFKWTRYQPATFTVRIRRESLNRSSTFKNYVRDILDSIKAAGVKVIVEDVVE